MRVRVAAGTQVHHDGVTYGEGDTVEVPDEVAAPWLVSGWVEPTTEPAKSRRKAQT